MPTAMKKKMLLLLLIISHLDPPVWDNQSAFNQALTSLLRLAMHFGTKVQLRWALPLR